MRWKRKLFFEKGVLDWKNNGEILLRANVVLCVAI